MRNILYIGDIVYLQVSVLICVVSETSVEDVLSFPADGKSCTVKASKVTRLHLVNRWS